MKRDYTSRPGYLGNCTEDDVVEDIFGSVTDFAQVVEEEGDDFVYQGVKVVYDQEEDIHYFYSAEDYE